MISFLKTFTLVLTSSLSLVAQSPDSLRIGLVLSGGGAKGYAHIGVLKVLEEAGVKIDQIGGTSMGAIVGGLYACGYSANQLEDIFRRLDPESLIFEEQARWSKSFFARVNEEKYTLSLSVNDLDILFPTALSSGQLLYDQLAQLTLEYRHLRDFSLLPIPFLCIATDLETGRQVILENGYLADALRASGSFPTLLAPLLLNGQLLSDGGIANNFPVAEVKAKGVDVIIGATVEDGLYTRQELNSVLRVVEQIGSFRMAERSLEQRQQCDLLIEPDITGFNVTSFESIDTLIARGERAARQQFAALLKLAANQQSTRRATPVPPQTVSCETVQIAAVAIQDGQEIPSPIEGFWTPGNPHPYITGCDFFKGIHQMRASGYYETIRYDFQQTTPNLDRVTLIPSINGGYRRSLRVGLHYDDVYGAGLLFNITARQAGVREGIFSLDMVAGTRFRAQLNYLIDRGRQVSPGIWSRLQLNEFQPVLPEFLLTDPSEGSLKDRTVHMTDFATTLDLRLVSDGSSAVGFDFGAHWHRLRSNPVVTAEELLQSANWYATASAYLRVDSRDAADIPERGWQVDFRVRPVFPLTTNGFLELSGAGSIYVDAQWEGFFPLGRRWNLQSGGRIGLLDGQALPPYYYHLGGFNRNLINHFTSFPGYAFAELSGSQVLTGYMRIQRLIAKDLYFQMGIQAGLIDQFSGGPAGSWRPLSSLMGSAILDTALGPLQFTVGAASGSWQVYLNFGHWF